MNRRFGGEAVMGVGGRVVTKEQQKSLDKAEELCRRKKFDKALPYLHAAIAKNPDNLDAIIQFAFLNDRSTALSILEGAERSGRGMLKRLLSDDVFEDSSKYAGMFWQLLETRPYMRVLQALVRLYFEDGQYKKCTETLIEMLRLCPADNLSQRNWLGSLLLRLGRDEDALSFSQKWLLSFENGDTIPRGGTAFATPSRGLISHGRLKGLRKWGPGTLLHTAAIAAYRLYGDCPLSRQYLMLAVQVQPYVLLKVLALVSRPEKLNNDARVMNGPEDAQDYLFLTQDLWMESEVWKWANENEDVRKTVLVSCSKSECGKTEKRVAEFKRCAACHLARYCSPTCQKEDWPQHKAACQERKYMKAFQRAMITGKPIPKDLKDLQVYTKDGLMVTPLDKRMFRKA